MNFLYVAAVLTSLTVLSGCTEKSTVKEETKVSTPTGTKTITTETEVKKTGDEKSR